MLEAEDPPEIPSSHLRPPRPALANLLADDRPETIAAAYEHGYTMPAIVRELGLHPFTISRRLARHAQIKT
jgi:IS30 family transposase